MPWRLVVFESRTGLSHGATDGVCLRYAVERSERVRPCPHPGPARPPQTTHRPSEGGDDPVRTPGPADRPPDQTTGQVRGGDDPDRRPFGPHRPAGQQRETKRLGADLTDQREGRQMVGEDEKQVEKEGERKGEGGETSATAAPTHGRTTRGDPGQAPALCACLVVPVSPPDLTAWRATLGHAPRPTPEGLVEETPCQDRPFGQTSNRRPPGRTRWPPAIARRRSVGAVD